MPSWLRAAARDGAPVLAIPEVPRPPSGSRWIPVEQLADPAVARDLVGRYSAWLAGGRLAAGAACSSQHYAGRLCSYAVAGWAATGRTPELQVPGLMAEVDEHGRCVSLGVTGRALESACHLTSGPQDPDELVGAVVRHMAPLVQAVCSVGHITRRVGWGGVAASVAGALTRALRGETGAGTPALEQAALRACASAAWPDPRPLVTWHGAARQPSHRRHTCCLIRLSPTHEECTTCPRKDFPPLS